MTSSLSISVRKITTWFCIYCCLFLTPISANALVICNGADGHTSVEKSVNGKCYDLVEHSHKDSSQVYKSESHCGVCVDTALVHEFGVNQNSTIQKAKITNPKLFLSTNFNLTFANKYKTIIRKNTYQQTLINTQNQLNRNKYVVIQV